MSERPLIIAHRGASSHAPENTLAAFRLAFESGADGVEFDVQLAKDGVPVVIHDPTLKRTGMRGERVADLTSAELGRTDVGSWFNAKYSDLARPEFADETVSSLVELLEFLKPFHGPVYVELKADEGNFQDLVAAVCSVLKDSPLLPRVIIKSFRLAVIPEVRAALPNVQTAALIAPQIMDYLRRKKFIIALAREFGADQLSLHRSLASRKLCSLAAEAGLPVTIWTANNPRWVGRSQTRGIGAVITNDPAKMIAARDA